MKNLLFLSFLILASCSGKNEYNLSANSDIPDGEMVYLVQYKENVPVLKDSINVSGGNFSFSDSIVVPEMYYLFFKNINDLNTSKSFIFNSLPSVNEDNDTNLWQLFHGVEIETREDCFNESTVNLMDFNCEQRDGVHFFYVLPFSKNRAMIESTWLSKKNDSLKDYESQIKIYLNDLGIKDYKINYREEGAIPLFYPINRKENNKINIGTAGGMTRLSTGYTFLNIQEHSKYIRKNIENIEMTKVFEIGKKYRILDEIFLRVLKKHPEKMPNIFSKIFNSSYKTAIKFLSNKSNTIEDISIILKMPKWIFIKSIFN